MLHLQRLLILSLTTVLFCCLLQNIKHVSCHFILPVLVDLNITKIPHAFSTNRSLPDATKIGISSVVVTCALLKNSFPMPCTANPMSVLLESSSVVVGNIVDVVGILTTLQSGPVYSLLQ